MCGPVFRRYYEEIRAQQGDTDLGAVWVIEPVEITNGRLDELQLVHEALHPTFRHLDRLLRKATSHA